MKVRMPASTHAACWVMQSQHDTAWLPGAGINNLPALPAHCNTVAAAGSSMQGLTQASNWHPTCLSARDTTCFLSLAAVCAYENASY